MISASTFFHSCGMTSLYAVTNMYSINSSNDSFVPVKDATARNHADLFTNLWITLIDWNRLFSINIIFISFQEDTTWRSKAWWKIKKQPKVQALRVEKSTKEQTQNPKDTPENYLTNIRKRGIQEAKLWWRRFTQYIKMTQNIDLNIMTTDREILENYRNDLEHRIKDLFIWALGESAITEMTRTVRDNDPNRMDINQLYSLFRLHFIPERNKFHSRADFFGITREKHESAEDVWTRFLQVEKNCEFENVTPAELIASKFLSVIGRSTGDYELKKKIRKSDMTRETITALIHEHMYDRLND